MNLTDYQASLHYRIVTLASLPHQMLLSPEHVKGLREDRADRATAHLDAEIFAVCILSAPGNLTWSAGVSVLFRWQSYFSVVDSDTGDCSPWPKQFKPHFQGCTHSYDFYMSSLISLVFLVLLGVEVPISPMTISAPLPSVSPSTRLGRFSMSV